MPGKWNYRHFHYGFACLLGIIIRYLFSYSTLQQILRNRVEISTPLNSWKRVTEGVFLYRNGISPYAGDVFHQVPLALLLYDHIIQFLGDYVIWLFVVSDLIGATFLTLTSVRFLSTLVHREKNLKVPASSSHLLVTEKDVDQLPFYTFCVYLFCPYTVLTCVAHSTTTFSNLLTCLLIFLIVSRRWIIASVLLATVAYHTFYPIVLLSPLILFLYKPKEKHKNLAPIVSSVILSSLVIFFLLLLSHKITNSWEFLHSTYGTILTVPDLTPNIGLFWYFFTEMFEHFRVLFLWTFQINAFIYVIPLSIRFKSEPMLLLCVLTFLTSIFKSYPSIGDYSIPTALLPIWKHIFSYMRQSFIVGCMLVISFVLAPLLWHLWIYSGSANSNFYFGITLAFNTGQIFLVTDLLFAFCKREYYMESGVEVDADGKPVRLDLR